MKKIRTMLLLLILLALTGCSCKHEWTAADCTSPQTCTKCSELGEAALGHQWLAATCTSPKTCSRCGETEGGAADHNYGEPTFDESRMYQTCLSCGVEQVSDIDRGVYLQTLLSGTWECVAVFRGDEVFSAYQLELPGDSVTFTPDFRFSGTINLKQEQGSLQFLEYIPEGELENYRFAAHREEGDPYEMVLVCRTKNDLLYIHYSQDTKVLLSRFDGITEGLAGTWGAEGGQGMCSLTFYEDRTVTGTLEEPFEGTWQLMPQTMMNGVECYGIIISDTTAGETVHRKGSVVLRSGTTTPEYVGIHVNDSMVALMPMTPEEIEAKETAMKEGPNVLIGTWRSKLYKKTVVPGDPYTEFPIYGYTFTFNADGTFTGDFPDRQITGNWTVDDHSHVVENYASYTYYLTINEDNSHHRLTYIAREGLDTVIQLETPYGTEQYSGKTLVLGQYSEETIEKMKAAPQTLVGNWTSTRATIHDQSTGKQQDEDTKAYSLTFQEDGTYSGHLHMDITGTWKLEKYDAEYGYEFELYVDQTEGWMHFSIPNEGYVNTSFLDGHCYYTYFLTRE